MSREPVPVSRRRLLAGVGAVGVAGATGGLATGAYLRDERSFTNALEAGELALELDCAGCSVVDDRLVFAFDGIDRGESDLGSVAVGVRTNPARLWLRTACPPGDDPLGDAIEATLSLDDEVLATGSLNDVRRSLATGVRLDADCVEPGAPLSLGVAWRLPGDVPDSLAGTDTALEAELVAEQCRHVEESDAGDPFAGIAPCEEPDTGIEWVSCPRPGGDRIAEAGFVYDGPPGEATVELVRDGVEVAATVEPGESFTATFHDPPAVTGGPDFEVVVDGAPIGEIHISCSRPFGPGLVVGAGSASLTVLSAVDTAGNELREVAK